MEEQLRLRVFLSRTEGISWDEHHPVECELERVLLAKYQNSPSKLRETLQARELERKSAVLTEHQKALLVRWRGVMHTLEVEAGLDRAALMLDQAYVNIFFYVDRFAWGPGEQSSLSASAG